jgi:hypothetical protein
MQESVSKTQFRADVLSLTQTISAQNALLAFTSIKTSNVPKSTLNVQTLTLKQPNAKAATMDTLYLRVVANCHRLRKNLK